MAKDLEYFLQEWGARTRAVDLAKGVGGEYFLLFDHEYEVRLSQIMRTIRIEADLGKLSDDRAVVSATFNELMSLQLACSHDASEVLSLDDETDHLILFEILHADRIDTNLFSNALSQFVNGQEFWMRQLKALRSPAASPFVPLSIVHA